METNAKHTPGPWLVSRGKYDEHRGYPHGTVRHNGIIICGLPPVDRLPRREGEEAANARLIAAAPALLAACEALCEAIYGRDFERLQDDDDEGDDMRATIAKARGEGQS